VEKWTVLLRPLFHSHYYDGICSSGRRVAFGGLVQTAPGSWTGVDNPFTNRFGFFW